MTPIPHPKIAFGDLNERLKSADNEVLVPRRLLASLLDCYISLWAFDEDWYLATYPDVQSAVAQGVVASGWAHYRAVGYLEGRLGNRPIVDTEWYVENYPDIAQAMLEGKVSSAADHYENFGYAEGRLPSDPGIQRKWYAAHYMTNVDSETVTDREVLQHYLKRGLRELALPAPPR